jgi:hypothetical protein
VQQVIHNPGAIPDARYNDTSTDITVVFEDSYQAYQTKKASLAALPKDRAGYSYMLHSVPTVSEASLRKIVDQLSQRAEFLFLTSLSQDYYESFDPQWANFADVVPT